MPSIRDDIHAAAEWISEALASSGYEAALSPNSLVEIDRFFSENSVDGNARHLLCSGLEAAGAQEREQDLRGSLV
jgi:hypothetical protein